MILNWSFGTFGFFLIPFYIATVNGNIFIIAMAMGAAEILASIATSIVSKYFSLKKAMFAFMILSCIASSILIFVTEGTITLAALILLLMFAVTSAFDVAYLINVELFPTLYLSTAYGACNIIGRFISIMSPIFAFIPHPWPMVILVVFSAICAVATLFLVKVRKDE